MNRLRKVLLTVIAAGALSTAPVALAGGPNDENNDHGNKDNGKTTICHATGSETNPYVQITVSNNALAAHSRHQGGRDIIPAPNEGCPAGEQPDDCEKHDECEQPDECEKHHGKKHHGEKHHGKKHHGKKHHGKKHHGKKHDGKKHHGKKHDDGKKDYRH